MTSRGIHTISLAIEKNTFTDEDTAIFSHIWNTLEEISSYKICCLSRSISDDVLTDFFYDLSLKATGMKSIAIDLEHCNEISDKGLLLFMENILPSMTALDQIEIGLSRTSITDESIFTFAKNIVPIASSLIDFSITLDHTTIKDQSLKKMFIPMPEVKSYFLSVIGCQITDDSIEVFAKQCLPFFKKLEKLEVYLSDTNLTDTSIFQLFSNIQNLKTLSLGLGNTRITPKFLKFFGSKCLPQMTSLKNLSFIVFGINFTDDDIAHICVPSKRLRTLCIALQSTRITDRSLQLLICTLLSSSKTLKEIILRLDDTDVTDVGVLVLLESLKDLKSFRIFLDKTNISNTFGRELINRVLPQMKHLEDFTVKLDETMVNHGVIDQLERVRFRLTKATNKKSR